MGRLAAAYAFGLSKNHGFVDGNKRVAAIVSTAFLILNGQRLDVTQREFEATFLKLAAGALTEEALADWFDANLMQRHI